MTTRTCPDWPLLMESAPELQFKHFTLREAALPAEVVVQLGEIDFDAVTLCCDPESHVFNAGHTDPAVAGALHATHWFDLREWATNAPGTHAV